MIVLVGQSPMEEELDHKRRGGEKEKDKERSLFQYKAWKHRLDKHLFGLVQKGMVLP